MHVLIALHDPSDVELTLKFAAHLKRAVDETSVVLAVNEPKKAYSQAMNSLAEAAETLGLPLIKTQLRIGYAGKEILSEAREGGYELVILGESDPTLTTPLISRESTATWVVERAACPVIVVKGLVRQVKRILLCDSGAENPLLSRMTLQLADLLEGEEEVTVLHVMSQISAWPGVQGKQLRAEADELIQAHTPEGQLLEQDVKALEQQGIRVQAKVRHGLVVDEILAEAQSGDYDLVVIGAHRDEGWQRFFLDDLAHKILVKMDRPVLVVR
jgi:nucleotide-binding universal stress UspA family protein